MTSIQCVKAARPKQVIGHQATCCMVNSPTLNKEICAMMLKIGLQCNTLIFFHHQQRQPKLPKMHVDRNKRTAKSGWAMWILIHRNELNQPAVSSQDTGCRQTTELQARVAPPISSVIRQVKLHSSRWVGLVRFK